MSKEKPKQEVQKAGWQPPAVPDFMKEDVGKGMHNIGAGDFEMPRIKLLQGISPELTEHNGLQAGMFWHTLAEVSLGKTLPVVPLYIDKRYVLWKPREDGGGILARADDSVHWQPPSGEFDVKINKQGKRAKWKLAPTVQESKLAEWGTYDPDDPNSQPAATLVYAMVVGLPTFPELSPSALLLQRSAVRVARKFLGKLKISTAPTFGMVFDMSSFDDSGPSGPFQNYRFTAAGFVQDKEQYAHYKLLHEQFKKQGVNIKDLEEANGEQPDGGGSGDGSGKSSDGKSDY